MTVSYELDIGSCASLSDLSPISAPDSLVFLSLGWLPRVTALPPFLYQGTYLSLVSTGVTDLSPLQGTTALGALQLHHNDQLESLAGLSDVRAIAGRLDIEGNALLDSLVGLGNLTTVDEWVFIFVTQLVDLTGLESLTSVYGLEIGYNEKLTSLAGVPSLTEIATGLAVFLNPNLPQCAADALAAQASMECTWCSENGGTSSCTP